MEIKSVPEMLESILWPESWNVMDLQLQYQCLM